MSTDERPTVSLSDAERRERRWTAVLIIAAAIGLAMFVAGVSLVLVGCMALTAGVAIQGMSNWHGYAAGRRAEAIDAYRRRKEGRL